MDASNIYLTLDDSGRLVAYVNGSDTPVLVNLEDPRHLHQLVAPHRPKFTVSWALGIRRLGDLTDPVVTYLDALEV